MARGWTRSVALLFGVVLVGVTACMTNHDALEKRQDPGAAGVGAGGSPGSAGHAPISGGGSSVAGSGHPDDETPGASVLTILHGVVDAPSIVLCFAKVASDGVAAPFGDPLSRAPLDYGQSLVLTDLVGADPATDALQPFVIAGDLELVSGLDCASAIDRARAAEAAANPLPEAGAGAAAAASGAAGQAAGGSSGDAGAPSNAGAAGAVNEVQAPLRVRALPAIPAGTLNGGRSYLLVAAGCMGGAGYSWQSPSASGTHAEDYCGAGYTEQNPTITLMFAALSRARASGRVGLQVLHASLATDPISVRSVAARPATDGAISIVAWDPEGALGPRPAYIEHSAFDYGTTRNFALEIHATRERQDATLFSQSWADVLTRGGVTSLEDGANYALVLVGPLADSMPAAAFWNPPTITVVSVDPN